MATPTNSKRISGEGRVTFVKFSHALLAKPGLDGGIFVVPSSLTGQCPTGYPPMTELLSRNDLVTFEAEPQKEKNGIKYVAIDGTVRVVGKASNITCKGLATVTKVDERHGQFGFVESVEHGAIFFNANVVRPETTDVTKVLKPGQRVNFEAIHQKNQQQCKYRATLVHLKSYKPLKKHHSRTTMLSAVPPSLLHRHSKAPPEEELSGIVVSSKSAPEETERAKPLLQTEIQKPLLPSPLYTTTKGNAPTPPVLAQPLTAMESSGMEMESPGSLFSQPPSPSYQEAYGTKPPEAIPLSRPLDRIIQQETLGVPLPFDVLSMGPHLVGEITGLHQPQVLNVGLFGLPLNRGVSSPAPRGKKTHRRAASSRG